MNVANFVTAVMLFLAGGKVFCSGVGQICDESVLVSEVDVFHLLFANYIKDGRPLKNSSDVIEIQLSLRISVIHELIERENSLVIGGYLQVYWHDEYLQWNHLFPYSCCRHLIVPSDNIWLPDVALVNSPNGIYSLMQSPGFTAWIDSDGAVTYSPGGAIVSQCKVDVTFFPFDRQICEIKFESWNFDSTQERFTLDPIYPFAKVDESWSDNNEWDVEANASFVKNVSYLTQTTYTHASFILVLRRKALFYYINIIAPSLIISVVELATFVLPTAEVIKIHISFTCLLAYSVFQGMVIDDLPRSGESVPMLSLYIDLQMAYIGIIALMGEALVFIVIRQSKLNKKPPWPWLSTSAMSVARVLCMEIDESDGDTTELSHAKGSKRLLTAAIDILISSVRKALRNTSVDSESGKQAAAQFPSITDVAEKAATKKTATELVERQWLFIADVLARANMALYLSATVLTPLTIFSKFQASDTQAEILAVRKG